MTASNNRSTAAKDSSQQQSQQRNGSSSQQQPVAVCFTAPRKWVERSRLRAYLNRKEPAMLFAIRLYATLMEVLQLLKKIIGDEGLFDGRNSSVIMCDPELEAAIDMKGLHYTEIRDLVCKQLVAVELTPAVVEAVNAETEAMKQSLRNHSTNNPVGNPVGTNQVTNATNTTASATINVTPGNPQNSNNALPPSASSTGDNLRPLSVSTLSPADSGRNGDSSGLTTSQQGEQITASAPGLQVRPPHPEFKIHPQAPTARAYLRLETPYRVQPLFLKVLQQLPEVDKAKRVFTYEELTKHLSKYILTNKERFFDDRNIRIAFCETDPIGDAFNVSAFHRTQVTSLLRSQLIPLNPSTLEPVDAEPANSDSGPSSNKDQPPPQTLTTTAGGSNSSNSVRVMPINDSSSSTSNQPRVISANNHSINNSSSSGRTASGVSVLVTAADGTIVQRSNDDDSSRRRRKRGDRSEETSSERDDSADSRSSHTSIKRKRTDSGRSNSSAVEQKSEDEEDDSEVVPNSDDRHQFEDNSLNNSTIPPLASGEISEPLTEFEVDSEYDRELRQNDDDDGQGSSAGESDVPIFEILEDSRENIENNDAEPEQRHMKIEIILQKEDSPSDWADSESDREDALINYDPELGPKGHDTWYCINCREPNIAFMRYCNRCWKERKDWLPARPKPKHPARKTSKRKDSVSRSVALNAARKGRSSSPLPLSEDDEPVVAVGLATVKQTKLLEPVTASHESEEEIEQPLLQSDDDVKRPLLQKHLTVPSYDSGISSQETVMDEPSTSKAPYDSGISSQETVVVDEEPSTSKAPYDSGISSQETVVMDEPSTSSKPVFNRQISTGVDSGFGGSQGTVFSDEENHKGQSNFEKATSNSSADVSRSTSPVPSCSSGSVDCSSKPKAVTAPPPKDNLCHLCLSREKRAGIVHGKIVHVVCCYPCARKLWKQRQPCPLCRRRIEKICEVITG